MSDNLTAVEGKSVQAPLPKTSLFKVFIQGLWTNNPGLCQLLGLCPLLAVTTTASSALGLSLATVLVVVLSSLTISLLRKMIYREIRIPIYVVLIASLVTVVRFYVEGYFPDLYSQLGIYLSLIVTNCIIMGRAEAFAGKNGPLQSCADALGCGIGFSLVLFLLGSAREIIGSGTWMTGAGELLGSFGSCLESKVLPEEYTLMIAILPPGGFFLLALLIAAKNAVIMHKRQAFDRKMMIKSVRN